MIRTDSVENAMAIRRQLAHDHHRPRYHFQAPANWMNDPNGFIHWRGQYHLFYQHHPFGPLHANMHWGHAVSSDLVHWRDLPMGLTPTPGGPDAGGCWSGCAVDNDGVPTLMYTGVSPEVQCIATGSPDMLTWTKYPGNPVIGAQPAGMTLTGFRDPCVWREGRMWHMVLGSGITSHGQDRGAVLLYRSPDLISWEYLGPLLEDDQPQAGVVWECPSFFPLGDRHVLFISVTSTGYVEYFVGAYREHRFEPDCGAHLDHSGLFYAPQSTLDAFGRRLLFGWLRESRSDALVTAAGWSGMQSVPRVLTLRPDGRPGIAPAPELSTLRRTHWSAHNQTIAPESKGVLPDATGSSLEILAEFAPGSASHFGLKLLQSPDGAEETGVVYDRAAQTLTVDRSRSCATPDGVDISPQSASLPLSDGDTLRLHIYLDGSAIEIFANGHTCLTSRVYPSRRDSVGLDVFAAGGSVGLKSLDVWQMASIWE